MQFSFEYCIDPKDHKSKEEYKAIAVEGAKQPKPQPDVMNKMEGYQLTIEKLQPSCGGWVG